MITASPASITVASAPFSFSIVPSLRRTEFSPIWPASPPASPNGRTRRWPERMVQSIFSRKRMVRRMPSPAFHWPRPPEPLRMWKSCCTCLFAFAICRLRVLLGFEFERQRFDLAGELERSIVAIFQQRDPGARVLPDVERFVLWERDRSGVLQRVLGHFLTVHRQYAGAAFAQTRPVGLEVEDDGVLARVQLGPFPYRALKVEQIVEEHHLAAPDAELTLAQEQAVAAEAPALGDDHALRPAFRYLDLGGDGVALVQDARRRAFGRT